MPALTGEKDSQQVLTLDVQEVGFEKKPVFDFFKRTFDIVFSLVSLIILSPFFIIIAIAIMMDNFGNPFFVQTRIGKNSKAFKMYKFRSMKPNSEKELDSLMNLIEFQY